MSFPDSPPSKVPPESWQRGTRFLGTRHAILGGAMAWLSEHHLVSAISEAGGFGVLASGNMPPEMLRTEILATRSMTANPFGVNLITLNPRLPELVQVVIEQKISHCVLAGGLPDQPTIDTLKQADIKVILFAPSLALAKRLIKRGADALIIEGHEAGGHVGPVTTSVLVQEILPHLTDVPVFAAGGIANGTMVAGLVAMGAAGCQLGTRFVVAHECIAHANFKNAFLRAQARDAQVTAQFDPVLPVIPVRALVNKGTQSFNALQLQLIQEIKNGAKERKTAQLELEHFWVGALKRAAIDGDVEHGSVMAGQSVGLVNATQSVAEIIMELTSQLH
ncbi:MAG: nitronate monooxygenase [Magnetococcales bacterium]|nr:nitronate monooxygenase [Magnetococcales bacterium]